MSTPTIPAGNLYMNATTYTGTGSNQTIVNGAPGASFQPDFVWLKDRTASGNHQLFNSVVGAGTALASNLTSAEFGSGGLSAFNSNGFTGNIGSTDNYVGWNWKAGGTAVSNTAGTITSQVSANTTSGFSVVTYTGDGNLGSTVGHGLGVAPQMVIVKNRNNGGAGWYVYHVSVGNTSALFLNQTSTPVATSSYWNNTTPTSSVFTIGDSGGVNQSTYPLVAYCWAPIAGYSQFGSYTGNGSTDGPFVYLGFRPKYVMIKKTSATNDWFVLDTSRSPYNVCAEVLYPNATYVEDNGTNIDILSNGFKCRNTASGTNQSGATYIYAAFAENPFKYANAR